MYTRFVIGNNLIRSISFRYQSTSNDEIFFRLTNDCHRKHFVHRDILSKAIENIHSNLTEKSSLLILTAAARYVHHITPDKRVELLEKVWKKFNEKQIRLTTRHYETYLNGLNENGFLFDSDYYLNLIQNGKIQATPRLYGLLLNQYSREGRTDRLATVIQMLTERHLTIDENIFSALILCQLKLGNRKQADEIIEQMKDRDCPPTISTYKEIFTVLINEHQLDAFKHYFSHIDRQPCLSSTLYIDTQLIVILLGQCISSNERTIFEYLLPLLNDLDRQRMDCDLFNLAIQCLTNQWYEYAVDLLRIQSNNKENLHEKHWMFFFKYLFDSQQEDLIGKFLQIMKEKQLNPLDVILRVLYIYQKKNHHLALNYLEQANEFHHQMRTNYFYPLFIYAHSSQTSNQWTDDHRLRFYRVLNKHTIPIDSHVYLRTSFVQYYQDDFRSLFHLLVKHNLNFILDRLCRLLLHDNPSVNILEQIAPYFHLENHTRREEFARLLFTLIAEKISTNTNEIFKNIDSISKNLINEIPLLKRELYIDLLGLSGQDDREEITRRLAEQCIMENIKIDRSINEIHTLTNGRLSDELVGQLSRYKPDELSWKEKFLQILKRKTTRTNLEEIYHDARQDGRYPIRIQQRLLEIYIQKRLSNQAMDILKEMIDNRYKIDSPTCHRLFNLLTNEINSKNENIQFLTDFYEKSFGLANLPSELIFRLAHSYLTNNDEQTAIKLITTKINSTLNHDILQQLIKYLQINSSLITVTGLTSIGNFFVHYRPNESIRQFWNHFFDILLEKTNPIELVQFYSDIMKKNSHIPYLHLFQIFIGKNEVNCLQDIVNIATLHHGSQNVFHDLGFILIEYGKTKQAERIFQKCWLKARNERISLHAALFANSDNLTALMSAINLTRNLQGVDQKQLFTSAIQVAIRLDKSDIVDSLVKEIEENQIQIDSRVKKFLDAHLLSKGLNRLNLDQPDKPNASVQQEFKFIAQN